MGTNRIRQPNRWSAVYNPIIYEFNSTWGTGAHIGGNLVVDTIGDTNGLLQIGFLSNHGLSAGDYVKFVDGDAPGYYRVNSIVSATQAIFNTSLASASALTIVYWTAYQYNMRVQVLDYNTNEVLGTKLVKGYDDGTDILFTFDISSILQTVITSTLPTLSGLVPILCSDAYREFYIQYREEYIKGVAGESAYFEAPWETDYASNYYDINDKVAVNSCEQYNEQVASSYKQADFLIGSNGTRFLTNQPDNLEFCTGGQHWLYFNNEEINPDILTVEVKQYDISGSLLSTSSITYSAGYTYAVGQHLLPVNTSLFTLSASAYKITFQVKISGNPVSSEVLTYLVNQNCCEPNSYQLIWLNNKGGYSTHRFTGRASHGFDVSRIQPIKFNLQPDNWKPSNRQYANLRNNSRESIIFRYECSAQEIHDWLVKEIMTTIDLFLIQTIDEVDYFIPMQINTNSVNSRKDGDKRFVLTFECTFAYDIINQNR